MSFWETAYKQGWASQGMLKQAVELGQVTPEEFAETTGIPFAKETISVETPIQ